MAGSSTDPERSARLGVKGRCARPSLRWLRPLDPGDLGRFRSTQAPDGAAARPGCCGHHGRQERCGVRRAAEGRNAVTSEPEPRGAHQPSRNARRSPSPSVRATPQRRSARCALFNGPSGPRTRRGRGGGAKRRDDLAEARGAQRASRNLAALIARAGLRGAHRPSWSARRATNEPNAEARNGGGEACAPPPGGAPPPLKTPSPPPFATRSPPVPVSSTRPPSSRRADHAASPLRTPKRPGAVTRARVHGRLDEGRHLCTPLPGGVVT
jgi:hypothetical protein